jgi:hypothetical protein
LVLTSGSAGDGQRACVSLFTPVVCMVYRDYGGSAGYIGE